MRFLCTGAFLAALAAQTPPPPPAANGAAEISTRDEQPVFQSRVSLVRVPVVVRDRQGKAVGGLTKEDFQVFDKGKPQRVTQFSAEGSGVPKPKAAAPAETETPLEAEEPSRPGQPPPVPPTHFTAYIFDDLHLTIGDLMQAQQAAAKHMQQEMRPTDRAAIFTLSGRVSTEFTDDRALLRAAVLKITPVTHMPAKPPFSYYMAEQIEQSSDEQNPSSPAWAFAVQLTVDCYHLTGLEVAAAPGLARSALHQVLSQGQQEMRGTLLMLKNLAARLAGLPGDRSVVLVSSGYYLAPDQRSDFLEAIDRAVRSNVIVNTLDARGVYALSGVPDLPGCGVLDDATARTTLQYERQENIANGMVLEELADDTGGTAFRSNNDLAGGFNTLSAPPEYIYYLGFYPENLKPDGSYHGLKVSLENRKGLSLRARKGYWAPSHPEDEAAQSTREIEEAVFSRDELRDIPLDVSTRFFKQTDEDAHLKVISRLDLKALHFRKEEGRNRDDVTLVCALFDRNGNFLKGFQKVLEMRLKDESLTGRLNSGISVGMDFDVKAGDYMIRVVVRDTGGRQIAAANASAAIP